MNEANAEAGPSGTHSRSSTSSSGFASPSRLPGPSPTGNVIVSSSFGQPSLNGGDAPGAQQEVLPPVIVRSINGPDLVPTVVGADGIREVPRLFELCQVDDLITLIASMLERLIKHNDRIPLTPTSLTRFHSRAPPSINVPDYLLRIARYTNVESAVLLSLLPYVDKVCARLPTFTVSSLTVHRFVIAGVSVGSKALSDSFCTNGRYSRVGGVSVAEMNLLEKEFCEAIDWRLVTTGPVLAHYYTSLVHSHPMYRLPPTPVPSPLTLASPPPPTSTPMDVDPLRLPSLSAASSISPDRVVDTQSPDLIPTSRLVKKSVRLVSASNLPSPIGGVRLPSQSVEMPLGGMVGDRMVMRGDEDEEEGEDGEREGGQEEEEEEDEFEQGEGDVDFGSASGSGSGYSDLASSNQSGSLSGLSIVSPVSANGSVGGRGGGGESTSSSPRVLTRPSSLHQVIGSAGSSPNGHGKMQISTKGRKKSSPLARGDGLLEEGGEGEIGMMNDVQV